MAKRVMQLKIEALGSKAKEAGKWRKSWSPMISRAISNQVRKYFCSRDPQQHQRKGGSPFDFQCYLKIFKLMLNQRSIKLNDFLGR